MLGSGNRFRRERGLGGWEGLRVRKPVILTDPAPGQGLAIYRVRVGVKVKVKVRRI